MVRMKQEVDALSREAGEAKPRRRLLNRTQSGTDHLLQETTQENVQESSPVGASHETDVFVERIVNMDEETKMLKEALAKRIDELQAARIMCAKTASRLSTVEEELEMLKSGTFGIPCMYFTISSLLSILPGVFLEKQAK